MIKINIITYATPLIPALMKQNLVELVSSKPAKSYMEFQASQDYKVRPCLKLKKKKKMMIETKSVVWHGIRIQLHYRNNSNIPCARETEK